MSKTKQRRQDNKNILQAFYKEGFYAGSNGERIDYTNRGAAANNKYFLGYKHGRKTCTQNS